MKIHYRLINRNPQFPRAQMRVACGAPNCRWTEHTTSDISKVECKRCLKIAEKVRKDTPDHE